MPYLQVLQQSAKQVEHTQRLLHVMRQGKAEAEEQKWAVQSEMQDLQAVSARSGGSQTHAARPVSRTVGG